MHFHNRYDGVDQYAVWLIQAKAKQLAGRYGFSPSDREDLEQELMLDLLRRMRHFDPARAKWGTFVCRIVEHKVASLIQHQRAAMRDTRRSGALLSDDATDCDGRPVELAEALDSQMNRPGRPDQEALELVLDVAAVVSSLPEDLRDFCLRLQTQMVNQVSRKTGVPRSVLRRKIARLRDRFENSRLGDYV